MIDDSAVGDRTHPNSLQVVAQRLVDGIIGGAGLQGVQDLGVLGEGLMGICQAYPDALPESVNVRAQ
jgi:hypothetical protein